MLLAAIARPEKTAALVGISTAADHIVTSFKSLPLEVGGLQTYTGLYEALLASQSIPHTRFDRVCSNRRAKSSRKRGNGQYPLNTQKRVITSSA